VAGIPEDCVAMYGGGMGKWYDKNCYFTQPFFIVEFGPPTIEEEVWDKENDDALDDDEFATDDKAAKKR
jgi:hypothetical protein